MVDSRLYWLRLLNPINCLIVIVFSNPCAYQLFSIYVYQAFGIFGFWKPYVYWVFDISLNWILRSGFYNMLAVSTDNLLESLCLSEVQCGFEFAFEFRIFIRSFLWAQISILKLYVWWGFYRDINCQLSDVWFLGAK